MKAIGLNYCSRTGILVVPAGNGMGVQGHSVIGSSCYLHRSRKFTPIILGGYRYLCIRALLLQ